MAVASLAIGVAGLAATWIPIWVPLISWVLFLPLGGWMVLGMAGLVLGIVAVVRRARRGIAVAGIVLNVAVILGPILAIAIWGI